MEYYRKLLMIVFALPIWLLVACDTSEQDFEKAISQNTVDSYITFINSHGKTELAEIARDSVIAIYSRNTNIKQIQNDADSFSDTVLYRRLSELIEQRAQMAYELAMEINTVEGWQTFIDNMPSGYLNDAEERLAQRKEDALWETESTAWQTAESRNTLDAYGKYLDLFPKGKHAATAEKRFVDLDVAAVFAGEHGVLPPMDKGYSTGASYSIIEIENKTGYVLTVSYSGPDSKRMVIGPSGTKTMRINNGHYLVAASVGHGVRPFAGKEYLDGSHFSSSFYIKTISMPY